METGSKRRLNRLLDRSSGKTVMIALDHGFTGGPLPGFESYAKTSGWIDHPSINALVLHRGALALLTRRGLVLDTPVIIQSNGSSRHAANPSVKPVLVEAEEATRLGADALSFEFNAGAGVFADNLSALSKQICAANYFGLPVMVMLAIDDCPMESRVWVKTHRDICRTLIDLGASIIKLRQPPAKEDWYSLMEEVGTDSLFVMAGGAAQNDNEIRKRIRVGIDAGVDGVCIGRNVFQNSSPRSFLSGLARDIHGTDFLGEMTR